MDKLTQNTSALMGAGAVVGYLVLRMLGGDYRMDANFGKLEKQLTRPVSLAIVAVAASVLLGTTSQLPSRITKLMQSPIARFVFLLLLGTVAAGDIESALASVTLVLISLQLLRTPQERQRAPYII